MLASESPSYRRVSASFILVYPWPYCSQGDFYAGGGIKATRCAGHGTYEDGGDSTHVEATFGEDKKVVQEKSTSDRSGLLCIGKCDVCVRRRGSNHEE